MAETAGKRFELELVDIQNPKEYNFILGHGASSQPPLLTGGQQGAVRDC